MTHRKQKQDLQAMTWDQAAILGLAVASSFTAFGIAAATVRGWDREGLLTPVGKAPGGAHLYKIAEVSAAADRPKRKPGRPPRSGTLHPDPESPTLTSGRNNCASDQS